MNGITYDAEQHRSTDAEGRDIPHVTHVLSAVGLAFDFDGLSAMSDRIQEKVAYRRALGTAVHADCHAFDDGALASSDPRVEPFIDAWREVREALGLQPLSRERRVYHPVHRYTGIFDGLFQRPRTRAMVDIKIGDPNDSAADLQTAAYEAAYLAEHPGETIDERLAIQLVPGRRRPYIVTNYSERPDAWRDIQKFLAALTVYNELLHRGRLNR